MASFIEGSGIQGSSGGITRDRVYQQVDGRKEELIKSLHGLEDTLQGAGNGGNLGPVQGLVNGAVQIIHRVSSRLERGSTEELVRDAQAQIRQRPGVFIAGCVALGFFAGRLLKI